MQDALDLPAGISPLFAARSIVVIGASDSPGNLGARVLGYLKKFSYPGKFWAVNPRRDTVAGDKCYPTPADLPEVPELAILAISAAQAYDAIKSCIDAGIMHGILWAGGFAETGHEGAERQAALAKLCKDSGFKLCGPNTVGIINSWLPMTASFSSSLVDITRLIPGNIAMVSQSGGTAITAQAMAQQVGFGFRYVVSSGNEAVLTVADYMRMVAADPHIKILTMYVEGARNGADFLEALGLVRAAGKKVVILKAGAAEASARAAAAHTGALAGEHRVWRALLREFGVITVHSLSEMVDMVLFLSGSDLKKLPNGGGIAVVSLGGESAAIAADLCTDNGMTTPALAPATLDKLKGLVPPGARIANPLVLTNQVYQPAWLEKLGQALDAVGNDPAIETVLFEDAYNIASRDGDLDKAQLELAEILCAFRRRTGKTVVVSWTPSSARARERLTTEQIFAFPDPVRAVETLAKVVGHRSGTKPFVPGATTKAIEFDWKSHIPAPTDGMVVSEHDCHRILSAAGLPVAKGQLATSADAAVAAATEVKYPVAIKGISPAVTHRAAAGLLALFVKSDEEVRQVFARLSERAKAINVVLDGVYVQHMEEGTGEVIVAAFRDPMFGVMVTCGAGGTATEILDDVAIGRAPLDAKAAEEMLKGLRIVKSLGRSGVKADLGALADFVARFSQISASAPWERFALEVNPVKWRHSKVVAVDGLLVIDEK